MVTGGEIHHAQADIIHPRTQVLSCARGVSSIVLYHWRGVCLGTGSFGMVIEAAVRPEDVDVNVEGANPQIGSGSGDRDFHGVVV